MSSDTRIASLRRDALAYHEGERPGKIEVTPTKPLQTQRDLSLAYTPGVAEPCLVIEKDPSAARRFTAKGNLVAVVSNGTAVLGLGHIGALAGKPVMEGKGVLFKHFADIDVFDIELDTLDPDVIIQVVKTMSPTFGGINLEDIKAPECFYIEERLREELDIPVFHDDQHGTAIISGAALLNALQVVGKKIDEVRVVVCGAGAAGIACADFYVELGVDPAKVLMSDSKGVLWKGRGDEGKNRYKDRYFRDTEARDLADAVRGADVFCGVSVKGMLTQDMLRTMADRPIVFAMANPDPEIPYDEAIEARPDAIVATGRSDYPNQVNNVLGFPFIFRGALDVGATAINERMKVAAAHSLADLAREEVPDTVRRAYGGEAITFGPLYIIPKPFDPRVLVWTSSAVAQAAMESGVAQHPIDIEEYRESLRARTDWTRSLMRSTHERARRKPARIVFPEGSNDRVVWAAAEIVRERVARPILVGDAREIAGRFAELGHDMQGVEVVDPLHFDGIDAYVEDYYALRQRKGVTQAHARQDLRNPFYFASMMVRKGDADGLVGGVTVNYGDVLRPTLRVLGTEPDRRLVAGLYAIEYRKELFFLADCTVNIQPSADDLAEIAIMAADTAARFDLEPRVAMLSFSNFGAVRVAETAKVREAVAKVVAARPDLMIDGPMQADVALDLDLRLQHYPFTRLKTRPNVLIFPSLDAANISYKLLKQLSTGHVLGPLIAGTARPVHLTDRSGSVTDLVNLAAVASVDCAEG
jgi:malate dehydrogenase (oxaloacetate-decarboxylating)(NADP+)